MRKVLLALAATLVVSPAVAQPSEGEESIEALEKRLSEEHAALSTSDCTVACQALGSIRRAADKICALDPGSTRCTLAKAKADDATRRVRDACPDCAIAFTVPLEHPAPEAPAAKAEPAMAESAPRKGGCAGCASAPGTSADLGWLVVVAWGLARLRRRRG